MTTGETVSPYLVEHIQGALAKNEACGVLGLVVRVVSGKVFISGSIPSNECREIVSRIAVEVAGGVPVVNETTVTPSSEPGADHEVLG